MIDKEKVLSKLYSLHRFGINPGLERTKSILESCGNPHYTFPSIHIAGTNGKGSVCNLIASILTEAGYKTGLYTSPHIIHFNERIRINGKPISDDDLIRITGMLFPASEAVNATFFEITTALAFKYFQENQVDIAIIETGMGGRFDSTNVINPILSIITNIDYEHQEYLGNTITEIANEKAGIIKTEIPVITGTLVQEVKELFIKISKEKNSKIYFSDEEIKINNIQYNSDISMTLDINSSIDSFPSIELPLAGKHQLNNIKIVFTALNILKNSYIINKESIKNGIRNLKNNTGFFSRIEVFSNNPLAIIDTAHNPGAFKCLIETIRLCIPDREKWNFVFGVMADKDIASILEIIKPVCNKLILCNPKTERAAKTSYLFELATKIGFENITKIEDVKEAYYYAKKQNYQMIVAGSFYLVAELF